MSKNNIASFYKKSYISNLAERWFRYTVISISSVWILLFVLIPQLAILTVVFLQSSSTTLVEYSFSLDAFSFIFNTTFLQIMWNSIILAFSSTLFCLLLAYPFAYAIATAPQKWRPLLLLLVVIPFWTNSIIRIYALIFFLKRNGVISGLLEFLRIIHEPISLMYTNTAIFLGFLYTLFPFMVLPIFVAIDKLDKKLCDAARDLGASQLRTFLHIMLPLTSPGIFAGFILVFLPTLTYFFIPEILGGSRTILLGNFIKNQFLTTRNWPAGALASSILILLVLVFMGLYYYIQKRAHSTTMEELH